MRILITGGAGFIGSNLIDSLLHDYPNIRITCIDNFDPFYGLSVKKKNIKTHLKRSNFKLLNIDIRDIDKIKKNLDSGYDAIIHLAAKVGVRPSVKDPPTYTEVNVKGTHNMLEIARSLKCKKFIMASSSSVYGVNPNFPWSEDDRLLLPASPYAFSKISGELLGYVYSNLYNIQFLALRLFTVYGPRQRPDLAIHKFAKLILQGKPIDLYGDGKSERDYTYIDDIIDGFISALNYSTTKYEVINLGNNNPVKLFMLINFLEKILKKKAFLNKLPDQPGDVIKTYADISKAQKILNYQPKTSLYEGLQKFIEWFKDKNETRES